MRKKGQKMTYPTEAVAKLKEANRTLRAEVKRLKRELRVEGDKIKQLEDTLAKNFEHVAELMDNVTVEEAIRMAKRKRKKPKPDTKQLIREKYKNIFCNKRYDE